MLYLGDQRHSLDFLKEAEIVIAGNAVGPYGNVYSFFQKSRNVTDTAGKLQVAYRVRRNRYAFFLENVVILTLYPHAVSRDGRCVENSAVV